MKEVKISTPFIKLSQFLKFAGIAATGGEADVRISAGEVKVNGLICEIRGKKLVAGDVVAVDGEEYLLK